MVWSFLCTACWKFPRVSISSSIAAMSSMRVVYAATIGVLVWYAGLPIPHKVFVHGNHDLPFELEPQRSKKLVPEGIHFLFSIIWNPTCRLISWYHTICHRVFWTMAVTKSVSLFWNDPLATIFSVITMQTMVR